MNRAKSNKFRLKNQKGATIIEAAFIMPLFFMIIFGIILLCTQLFACYKTYYATYLTLKAISTGPTYTPQGVLIQTVEQRLNEILPANYILYGAGVKIGTADMVIVRNDTGCFRFQSNGVGLNPYVSSYYKCLAQPKGTTFRILPNSWITIESHVKPPGLKFKNIPIPTMKIVSTTRMYDWS